MHDILITSLTPFFLALLVATGIGLIIGLEREFNATVDKDEFAGLRTFPLVSIAGCLIAYLVSVNSPWLVTGGLSAFILFVAVTYWVGAKDGHRGLASEITLIITFLLGIMSGFHLMREALGAAVVVATLLSLKGQFKQFMVRITQEEVYAFIKFIILVILLLPFLPNENYGPGNILNPREIGWVVVIVSALSFIGYLLIKFVGADKGILLTAFFGGMFSSTAVAWVFSSRSKEADKNLSKMYGAGIMLASAVMFVRVALVSFIFNRQVFMLLVIPCAILCLISLVATFILAKKAGKISSEQNITLGNPLNLLNAIGFAALFIAIMLAVYFADKWLGNAGLLISGIISGFADVDAINISMSKFALSSSKVNIAVLTIVAAVLSNTAVKTGISIFKGSKDLRKSAGLAFAITLGAGLLYAGVMAFVISNK
jgi:uncharacterized membrane protein (DUF4010 family)